MPTTASRSEPTGQAPPPSWRERVDRALRRRLTLLHEEPEAGMSTAEYAVGTVAACAFAAVLYRVVTGDSVVDGLTDLVDRALATLA
jgi:glutathione S-transferase